MLPNAFQNVRKQRLLVGVPIIFNGFLRNNTRKFLFISALNILCSKLLERQAWCHLRPVLNKSLLKQQRFSMYTVHFKGKVTSRWTQYFVSPSLWLFGVFCLHTEMTCLLTSLLFVAFWVVTATSLTYSLKVYFLAEDSHLHILHYSNFFSRYSLLYIFATSFTLQLRCYRNSALACTHIPRSNSLFVVAALCSLRCITFFTIKKRNFFLLCIIVQ